VTITPRAVRVLTTAAVFVAGMTVGLHAHDGPPFPIVSNQAAGPYIVSLWTDPDTTDDGSAGGQFWLMVRPAAPGLSLPATTRGTVVIRPLDRTGPEHTGQAEPVEGDVSRQFVALVMDHEGRFDVHVSVEGPLGPATFQAEVEGTYDARPAPIMLLVYLAPFVLIGGLWIRAMTRRRQGPAAEPRSPGPDHR
jgi:hypothetical protein